MKNIIDFRNCQNLGSKKRTTQNLYGPLAFFHLFFYNFSLLFPVLLHICLCLYLIQMVSLLHLELCIVISAALLLT